MTQAVTPQLRDADSRPCLVWRFGGSVKVLSSAPVGGGLGQRRWALNAQVPSSYAETDLAGHVGRLADQLGCDGTGVGMLTAAPVRRWQRHVVDDVAADATVGVTDPTWAAQVEAPVAARPGTINIVVQVPVPLAPAALVNAVITATEAKSQALLEAGVAGTGTPTDAVCIVCPTAGTAEPFAGPRSLWGGRLALAVHGAVRAGLEPT